MIERLYDLEDRLFYAAQFGDAGRRLKLERLSERVGQLADSLDGGFLKAAKRLFSMSPAR